MIEIKNRWSGAVIHRDEEAETLRDAVIRFIANKLEAGEVPNLSDANLSYANLSRANLSDANLSHANLSYANLRSANLRSANLSRANLSDANLSDANLSDANLSDANLSYANLSYANLSYANLSYANNRDRAFGLPQFGEAEQTNFESVRDAYRASHPDIPVVSHLDRAICELVTSDQGKLDMSNWHSCDTTHCRAGWAIHQAGEAGYALEERYGPEMAGGKIYMASTGRWPDFFASNVVALADICEWGAKDTDEPNTATA